MINSDLSFGEGRAKERNSSYAGWFIVRLTHYGLTSKKASVRDYLDQESCGHLYRELSDSIK